MAILRKLLNIRMARTARADLVPAARTGDGQPEQPGPDRPGRATALDPSAVPGYFGPVPYVAYSPRPRLDGHGRVVPGTGIRKFVDTLPLPTRDVRDGPGNRLPVAVPDTTSYPGCDYYEIGLCEYRQRLHRDLPATRLRGYRQLNMGTDTDGHNTVRPPERPYHCGPVIVAHRGRPVRIRFVNQLPVGRAGELFLPVDETLPGAGPGPLPAPARYPQNRAVLHLAGSATGWISAGLPTQWLTPAGEVTPYPVGPGYATVPDMPTPGPGAVTLYHPNEQSARLMWFHDNTLGLARLTVHSGQLGLYLLDDPAERRLVADGVLPATQIPLVIEDKTFVPDDSQLAVEDPVWDRDRWGSTGSIWYPHVYLPNQNPYRSDGRNPVGRWDYGPWCAPEPGGSHQPGGPEHLPVPNPHHDPVAGSDEPPLAPGTPHPSAAPMVFGDTPLVNGVAYPYLTVRPTAYRFRILNACADRYLNLQLYRAASDGPMWQPDGALGDAGAGEVPMVGAVPAAGRPAGWPTDGRAGGVPDPAARGPAMIQIGSEGGLLPAPVTLVSQPVDFGYDRREATVLNATRFTLLLAPGERADVVIDFSSVPPGTNLILYNDAPAPLPGFDPRYDHYTGGPDLTGTGGAPPTMAGYGPNTRTLLQFRVAGTPTAPFDLETLAERLPAAYAAGQLPPIVPQPAYDRAFGTVTPVDTYVPAHATAVTFTPAGAATPVTLPLAGKAVLTGFEAGHGRVAGRLGVALPGAGRYAPVLPLGAHDPATEVLHPTGPGVPVGSADDGTQLWRISPYGRQTEVLHFPFDVQVVNRVGRDGLIRPPDGNELGWKQAVRVDPQQDVVVALRPAPPLLPFRLGDSVRLPDPTRPPDAAVPPGAGNRLANLGWEYRWQVGPTGHRGGDASRPLVLRVTPPAPTGLTGTPAPGSPTALPAIMLTWTGSRSGDRPAATGLLLQRATDAGFSADLTTVRLAPGTARYPDPTVVPGVAYHYRVRAETRAGYSAWSNSVCAVAELSPPSGLTSVVPPVAPLRVALHWTNRSFATGVEVQRATNPTFTSGPGTTTLGVTDRYPDGTVAPDTTYYYRVRTTYLGAASPWSNVSAVVTPAVPQVPTGLTATGHGPVPDSATVHLGWSADLPGAGGGFVVQRAADGRFSRGVVTFTVTGRGFHNTGLARGCTYHYRIRAFNVVGTSAFSSPVAVTTPA
ncbi:hypothetical protein V6U90_11780 [Micromonospora sp. CPCC 206060]|uniref:hypothetical protein n=1 Tax=Micromonospora sp. CPCC 206060 TaxID=3122406 RepID=UPI002FEE6EBF